MKTSPPPSLSFGFPPLHLRWRGGQKGVRIAFLFCFLSLISSVSFASYISMSTSVESKVINNDLLVTVFSQNKGDEPAYSVQSEIKVGDKTIMGQKKDQLEINAVWLTQAQFSLKEFKPGQYPIIILQHYADANQYPFSAPVMRSFNYRSGDRPADVFGKLSSATFWKDGELELTIKNMSDANINAKVSLVIPKELSGSKARWEAQIGSRSEDKSKILISNFSALSGSSYQVYAIVEYEINGFHQAVVIPGMVKIEELNYFKQYKNVIFVAIGGLLLLFIASQFVKNEKP